MRRLAFALTCILFLTQCGYRPLYGPAGVADETLDDLAQIAVNTPEDRPGASLKRALTDVLSKGQLPIDPLYRLDVRLEEDKTALAIQLDSTITRNNLTTLVEFILRRQADDEALYRGKIRRVGSFNVRQEPYATLISERDVEQRNVEEVAREIRLKLAAWFANNPNIQP